MDALVASAFWSATFSHIPTVAEFGDFTCFMSERTGSFLGSLCLCFTDSVTFRDIADDSAVGTAAKRLGHSKFCSISAHVRQH